MILYGIITTVIAGVLGGLCACIQEDGDNDN